jgi:hypothetical protein
MGTYAALKVPLFHFAYALALAIAPNVKKERRRTIVLSRESLP